MQWDVEAAYLKGKFPEGSEVLYARPPPGYRKYVNGIGLIWMLKTPLYGEADAGRIWYQTFMAFLLGERGFTQSKYDPCLLWKTLSIGSRMVMVFTLMMVFPPTMVPPKRRRKYHHQRK